MLTPNIYKNLCSSRFLSYGNSLTCLNNILSGRLQRYEECNFCPKAKKAFFSCHKNYNTDANIGPTILPPLCDHVIRITPSLLNMMKQFFLLNMVIRPKIDRDFVPEEFLSGSEQALYTVSCALANEDYESLDGLVTPEVINTVKPKISLLTALQKDFIAVFNGDVFASFPYEMNVLTENEKGRERKYLQILMIHHYLRGCAQTGPKILVMDINSGQPAVPKGGVANYRFIREYTEGVDSSWTIDMVNHVSFSYLAQ